MYLDTHVLCRGVPILLKMDIDLFFMADNRKILYTSTDTKRVAETEISM